MNAKAILTALFCAAAPAAFAEPFTVRQVPAGFDAPDFNGGGGAKVMFPIAADFLRNGRLQWYQGGNVISKFPENGTITLPAITLPQTPSATVFGLAAAVCDVDRDGDQDLVRINQWNGNLYEYTLQVFLNHGGTFTVGSRLDWTNSLPWSEGAHRLSIVPADYDKDGDPDLAILETYSSVRTDTDPDRFEGKLYIRWNDGTGVFAASSYTTLQGNGLTAQTSISTADYDRDGDADIHCSEYVTYGPDQLIGASPRYDRSLLFTNGGDGTFSAGSNFPDLMPAALLDLNGDGWADLADSVNKAMNNGDGTFGSKGRTSSSNGAYLSTFADIDGDGLPELIVASGSSLIWFAPDGAPPGFVGTPIATLPATPDGIGAADSDGDGDTDLFVSLNNGSFVFVENQAFHTLPGALLAGSVALGGVSALHSADFNRDGFGDVLAVTPSQERLWLIAGQSNGTPGAPYGKFTQSEAPHSAAVADFNSDGLPDVAYTLPTPGMVRLAINNGSVTSPAAWSEMGIASGLTGVSQLVSGDYGLPDGLPDLYSVNSTTGQIRAFYQANSTWFGRSVYDSFSPIPNSLAAGELTSTAGSELGILSSTAAGLNMRAVRFNSSGTGWTQHGNLRTETVTGGPHTAKMIWADGTGDRYNDGIFINGNGALAVWAPVGNLSFELGTAPSRIRDFTAVDWNRDGRTDFLCATDTGLGLFHYDRSRADWQYTELYRPASGGYAAVTTLHFDRDGWPDAAAASSTTTAIHYLRNTQRSVRADLSAIPDSLNVTTGTTAHLFTVNLRTGAHTAQITGLADPSAAVSRSEFYFQTAVPGPGGTWIPGSSMTQNAVNSYFTSAALIANGSPVASDIASSILSNGSLFLDNDAPGSIPAPIPAGNSLGHTLRLTIAAPNAQQTGNPRFFVTVKNFNAYASFPGFVTYPGAGDSAILENSHPILINIVPSYTPLQTWRDQHFGNPNSTGTAANNYDYDGDGVLNLVEYFTGSNPTVAERSLNAALGLTVFPGATPQTAVSFRLYSTAAALADTKVRVTIQAATGSLNSWSDLASRTGGGSWTGLTPASLPPANGVVNLFFTTTLTRQTTPKLYLRLKVEELP